MPIPKTRRGHPADHHPAKIAAGIVARTCARALTHSLAHPTSAIVYMTTFTFTAGLNVTPQQFLAEHGLPADAIVFPASKVELASMTLPQLRKLRWFYNITNMIGPLDELRSAISRFLLGHAHV